MYCEFKGGPMDGKVLFLPIKTSTIIHSTDSAIYYYRKTPRIRNQFTIYQYLGILEPEDHLQLDKKDY